MKTTAVTVAAILASTVFAQPYHGRHLHKKNLHKREYVTTWVTQTETATLIIDQYGTSLVEPSPGQFYPSTSEGTTSTTSTSTSTSTSSSSTSTSTTSTPTTSSSTYTTPTSTYVQPTTTTQAQETTHTTTSVAPVYTPTTSAAAAPTSGSGSSSGYSGDITFYDLGLGACGVQLAGMTPDASSPSNPAVVAIAYDKFTATNPNADPLCGKMIKITGNGKVGYGMVRDRCQACAENDLDLNIEAFEHFYDSHVGRAGVTWEWM